MSRLVPLDQTIEFPCNVQQHVAVNIYIFELDGNYYHYYEDGSALGSLEGRFQTVLVFLGRHWQRAVNGGQV